MLDLSRSSGRPLFHGWSQRPDGAVIPFRGRHAPPIAGEVTFTDGLGQNAAHAVISKLERFVPLDDSERQALRQLAHNAQRFERGTDLIAEGDKSDSAFLMLEGWACRYKSTADGDQQIVACLLPGDLCDVQSFLLNEMDHSIGLLSDALVAKIPSAEMTDVLHRFPRIERALQWATLVEQATLCEWLLALGRRDAPQRLAHLFCELCVRLSVVGLVEEKHRFEFPLTQSELADAAGMTAVHTNRSLQRLRRDGLIDLQHGILTILDFERLKAVAGFSGTYLHAGGRPA